MEKEEEITHGSVTFKFSDDPDPDRYNTVGKLRNPHGSYMIFGSLIAYPIPAKAVEQVLGGEKEEEKMAEQGKTGPGAEVKVKVGGLNTLLMKKIDELVGEKQIIYQNSDNADDSHRIACQKLHDIEVASDRFDDIIRELREVHDQVKRRLREIKSLIIDDHDRPLEIEKVDEVQRLVRELI